MARRLLIFLVFAGLSFAALSSGVEIRRFLDGQFQSMAMLTKARL